MNAHEFRSTKDKNGRIVGEIIERAKPVSPTRLHRCLQIAVTDDDEGMDRSRG